MEALTFTIIAAALVGLGMAVGYFLGGKRKGDKVSQLIKLSKELEKVVENAIKDGEIDKDEYREIREKSIDLLEIIDP